MSSTTNNTFTARIVPEGQAVPRDMINWNTTSGGTVSIDYSVNTTNTIWNPSPATATAGCNESKVHDNDQKAVFHGMKSAFRMSRVYDGKEYGSDSPQWETAIAIAANVGKAYIEAKDELYDPEESIPYLDDNFPVEDRLETAEQAIERAWRKIDSRNHLAGARIAVSLGDLYLDSFHPPERDKLSDKVRKIFRKI